METPEQQAKELEAKAESEGNIVTLNLSPRQLGVIGSVTNDKKVLEDRLGEVIKREKDAVNLILEAHGVDPMTVREVRMDEGRMIASKYPPIEKKLMAPKDLKEQVNGVAEPRAEVK